MKEYNIEYYPNEEDIKQMIQLDNEVYNKSEDCGILEKCLQWKKICPEIYTVIKDSDKVVGYINFVSITKKCYEDFRHGKIKDYQLDLKDIVNFSKGDNYCLFMSVVVKNEYQDKYATKVLLDAFYKRINDFHIRGIKTNNIIADCVSKDGEKFITKRFNASCVGVTETNSKLYEFSL